MYTVRTFTREPAGRFVQLHDGPYSWFVMIPTDVPSYARIINAPASGSYGAGWAEDIISSNMTVRVCDELAAVWPTNADQPAWLYQRSGHARTGRHDHELAWCPNHAGYLVGPDYCSCDGWRESGCPSGQVAWAGLDAARRRAISA